MSDTISATAEITLSATDRCDRCSAAARVHVALPLGGELFFCNHHFGEHRESLAVSGAIITESAPTLV